MEQNAAQNEVLRRATQHLQNLLLRTPGKSPQVAASEAEAIASLAFVDGNPVRDLFITSTPRADSGGCKIGNGNLHVRDAHVSAGRRSPSPTPTIRPKSSKAFFKFGRGSRDKSSAAPGSSSSANKSIPDGISPLFEQCFGPIEPVEEKKPKRKERACDFVSPATVAGPSKAGAQTNFNAQQRPGRTNDQQYRCIVCDQLLSSKGVCKRHLEDQHITPKVYECEECHAYFETKADAKKHCSQCCGDAELSWTAVNLPKKVYACEYTGSYFLSKERYSQHLLVLSEPRGLRPRANLNTKLDAILRHAGKHNDALMPLCGQISQSLFGSHDAWKELLWDPNYLQAKITVLEHATFNDNGTIESTRWSGSAPKRRNTESYLTQLFQAGRMPDENIKPEEMSVCSTPMPVTFIPPSGGAGAISVDAPLRVTSPVPPRSQSRQTVWSHDGTDRSTSASTPRSVPAGEEVMTAELKSKRHLSDESRSYIPARTPPGPPEPPEQYAYHPTDPSLMGHAPQLPPLPAFMTPSTSSVSLPLRKQEGNGMAHMVSGAPHYHPMYQLQPADSNHTLASDTASETSTLAQSYREPEFLDQYAVPIDYKLWQQQLAFQQQQQQQQQQLGVYQYNGGFDYSMPDDASIVASSINTGNTIGVDYVTEIPKMEGYGEMDLSHHGHAGGGTFFLDGEGREEEMR